MKELQAFKIEALEKQVMLTNGEDVILLWIQDQTGLACNMGNMGSNKIGRKESSLTLQRPDSEMKAISFEAHFFYCFHPARDGADCPSWKAVCYSV